MMSNKKTWLALALLLCLAVCCACGASQTPTLDEVDNEQKQYDSFSLTLPLSWTETAPTDEQVVCAYQADEGRLELQIFEEWGGMEYYSLDEVGDILCQDLSQALFAGQAQQEQQESEAYYCCTLSGQDAAGTDLVCHVDVLAPYASVRYYLIYTADKASYEYNQQIIKDILPSFTMSKTAEQIYQEIEEQRTQAAEQAAEQQETIE